MPDLNREECNKKNVLSETAISVASPPRLVALAFVLGSVFHSLEIPGLATFGIFGWIGLLALASVGFNAIVEKNLRIQGKNLEWILYIVCISLGTISLEYAGILAHTASFLMPDHLTSMFWDGISIVLFMGGFGLSAFQSYTKRFIGMPTNDRTKMIFIVFIIPALIYLLWITYNGILSMIHISIGN